MDKDDKFFWKVCAVFFLIMIFSIAIDVAYMAEDIKILSNQGK